jgi:hypothetical protein
VQDSGPEQTARRPQEEGPQSSDALLHDMRLRSGSGKLVLDPSDLVVSFPLVLRIQRLWLTTLM